MSSIIVFSKDRPMQLHAYLESLLYYSDAQQNDITVLYKETPDIDYTRVIKEFSSVNWIAENRFYDDLMSVIEKSDDYIMFGCDDVVFKNKFSLKYAQEVLSQNEQIFGFSFRLGKNIIPYPTSISNDNKYIEWNWKEAVETHYNYPWELDCTLYRKSDILKMLDSTNETIKSPNYLESEFANNPKQYILRPNLACLNMTSQAIVITVNRVQDTHCNPIDDSKKTDIYTLNKIYNEQNNKLDIKAIANMNNYVIHAGSEYFVLENRDKSWKKPRIKRPKNKKRNPLKLFFKNIGYLFRYSLKEMSQGSDSKYISRDQLNLILDGIKYELADDIKNLKKPNIKSPNDTIVDLIKKKTSFCRFGDGEFVLMEGGSIPFQKSDSKLSQRLNEIFRSNDENIFIGVPYSYYASTENMQEQVKNFMRCWVSDKRNKITALCDPTKQYYDTGCSQMYAMYKKLDFASYFEQIKEIWLNQDIAIICGKTVFDKIETNIFDCAKSVEYMYAPSMNAFEEYEFILTQAKQIDKNKKVIIILGPTATVLSYDLAKEGYQAIDFGHIAKDYDCYSKKIEHTTQTIIDFFDPD